MLYLVITNTQWHPIRNDVTKGSVLE